MSDFLTKPIDPQRMLEVIQLWHPQATGTAPPPVLKQEEDKAPDIQPLKLPGIDVEDGLHRMLNRQPLFEKILRDFEARFTGETARIRAALAADDLALATRRAHSVKGTGGMISAKELAILAAALEQAIKSSSPEIEDCLDRFDIELERVLGSIRSAFDIAKAD
jgi:HPt (histidine-containing phosphotransfer) domain-containing protein